MTNEILLELAKKQELLRAINSLSNCIAKCNATESKDIAYLIHRLCEAIELNSELAREVMSWKIQANKELFINVK